MNYPIPFGKYQLLERVNIGGMAEIFKSKAFGIEGFERIIAIKRILPNMAEDDEFIKMFVDEARIAVQLTHPNIVQIYELGKFENQYYIAMAYVSGKDLRQILDRFRKRKETIPLPAAALIAAKICEGLDYAHRKTDPSGRPLNLIHRDVSPQNILVSYEGTVQITDFGIAKAEDRASKTQAGVLKGKFGYMSPEQVRGLETDNRSDVFAVGILLYEMLTGKRLFIGQSDFSTLEKVRNGEVPPPREHNPDLPEELERIMLKALARDRDERYRWASDLHEELQQFLISDNTIYNAKRLSELMNAEYASDIEAENRKMEEFMRLSPPAPAPEEPPVRPASTVRADDEWSAADKTTIFESGFGLSSQATRLLDNAKGDGPEGQAPTSANQPVGRATISDEVSEPKTQPNTPQPQAALGRSTTKRVSRSHVGAILVAGAAFMVLLGLLVVILALPSAQLGSIEVTSTPAEVELFIDDQLVATKSPYRTEIATGKHILAARAPGFRDKAFRFELGSGGKAQIDVQMEPEEEAEIGVVEIVSDPPGASVQRNGLPQGVTPLTLQDSDFGKPVTLVLIKDGYEPETVSTSFKPGLEPTVLRVSLKKVGAKPPPPPPAKPAAAAPKAEEQKAVLVIASHPDRAQVTLDGDRRGVTPLEFGDLDPQGKYSVVITKDGYRRYTTTVDLKGRAKATVMAKLRPRRGGTSPAGGCNGKGAFLSVMPVGIADCKIFVADDFLGVAPMFKQQAPSGRCPIEVKCPNGRKLKVTRTLRLNSEEKLIIKPNDWNE